ncbi:hypothetical protein KAZ66_05890 [Candidatus Woesebacteria bacterium]|nr:hypothetical protein [Candidatus Woesebacteria bacterium]
MKKYIALIGFIIFLYLYFSILFTFITCFPPLTVYMVWFFIPFLLLSIYVARCVLPRHGLLVSGIEVLYSVNIWYLLYTAVIFPLLAWPGWADNFLEGRDCPFQQGLFINSFVPIYFLFILFPTVLIVLSFFGFNSLVYKRKTNIPRVLHTAFQDLSQNLYSLINRKVSIFIFALFLGLLLPSELKGIYDHIKFDVKDSIYSEESKNQGLSSTSFYFKDLWGDYYFTDTFHFRREIIPGSGIYYFDLFPYRPEPQDIMRLRGSKNDIYIYKAQCDNKLYFSDYYTNGGDVFYQDRWLSGADPTNFGIVCGEVSTVYPNGNTFSYYSHFGKSQDTVYYKGKAVPGVSAVGLEYTKDGIWQNIQGSYAFRIRYTTEGVTPLEVTKVY